MSEDKRKHSRFKVSWPCRLLLSSGVLISAKIKDVSLGGVGLELSQIIAVDESLSIEMKPMIDGKVYLVRAKASVVFSLIKSGGAAYSIGLKFDDMPEEYKLTLAVILKSMSKN